MAQAKYYILLLLVCLIWGATPASGKFTVEAFSPLMITGMRFAIIAAVLFAWLYFKGDHKDFRLTKETFLVTLAMGFMGVLVHNGMLFLGLTHTTATNTALIESIGPTATTVLAFLFLGERLNKFGWLGIVISCFGALCIVSKGSISTILNLTFNIGDVYILICEIAWSCYAVISWRIHGKMGTLAVTAWSGLFGAIFCFITGAATDTLHVYEITTPALIGFSYLVIFSGIFAFVAWNAAIQVVGASKAGVFVYLVPLTGGFLGVLVLGEEIHAAQIYGALFIMGGVILTIRSKVQMRAVNNVEANQHEPNLMKRFPELAEAHDQKVAAIIETEKVLKERGEDPRVIADEIKAIANSDEVPVKPLMQFSDMESPIEFAKSGTASFAEFEKAKIQARLKNAEHDAKDSLHMSSNKDENSHEAYTASESKSEVSSTASSYQDLNESHESHEAQERTLRKNEHHHRHDDEVSIVSPGLKPKQA